MFVDELLADDRPVDPRRLDGCFTLYDDGWRCGLDLRPHPDGVRLDVTFRSYDRTPGLYQAGASLDAATGEFRLTVQDFNELDTQIYDGLVSRSGPVTICGTTDWQGDTFGFFAVRRPPHAIGIDIIRPPTLADIVGTFRMWVEDASCVVSVDAVGDGTGHGNVRLPTGESTDVVVRPSADGGRRFELLIDGAATGSGATASVWMFDRRHDALAGWFDAAGRRSGCYLLRVDAAGSAP